MSNILIMRSNINSGGPSSLIRTTVKGFVSRGHRVVVACGGGNATKQIEECGAKVIVFDELSFTKRSVIKSVQVIPKIRKCIVAENIDKIYGFNTAATLIAYLASRGVEKKINIANALLGNGKEWFHRMMPFCHVCMSDVQKEEFVKKGIPEGKLYTVYPTTLWKDRFDYDTINRNCIRTSLGIEKDEILIGTVMVGKGRTGFENLIIDISNKNPKIKWAFVGQSSYYDIYKNKVQRTEIEERFMFLGLRSDIPELMCAFDIFSHYLDDSIKETFGMVLTEAMSMYTPVVTNNYGGMTEIVDNGATGFLVNNDDEYIKRIIQLAENKELRDSFSENGYKKAWKCFSAEAYIKGLENVLEVC